MIEIIEAKQKQATEQMALWQRKLAEAQQQVAQAQEQLIRWDAVLQVCGDFLAEAPPENPGALTASEKVDLV